MYLCAKLIIYVIIIMNKNNAKNPLCHLLACQVKTYYAKEIGAINYFCQKLSIPKLWRKTLCLRIENP
jgi:plasmid rolling circle replication initiator protein Rep